MKSSKGKMIKGIGKEMKDMREINGILNLMEEEWLKI